jgi:hypothetical protein
MLLLDYAPEPEFASPGPPHSDSQAGLPAQRAIGEGIVYQRNYLPQLSLTTETMLMLLTFSYV